MQHETEEARDDDVRIPEKSVHNDTKIWYEFRFIELHTWALAVYVTIFVNTLTNEGKKRG